MQAEEFDGMIDLKYNNGSPYGNDFIFCSRQYSTKMGGILLSNQDLRNPINLKMVFDQAYDYLMRFASIVSGGAGNDDFTQMHFQCKNERSWELNRVLEAFESLGFSGKIEKDETYTVLTVNK